MGRRWYISDRQDRCNAWNRGVQNAGFHELLLEHGVWLLGGRGYRASFGEGHLLLGRRDFVRVGFCWREREIPGRQPLISRYIGPVCRRKKRQLDSN